MKTKSSEYACKYQHPCCIEMDISSEGILCSSIQGIDREFDYSFDEE